MTHNGNRSDSSLANLLVTAAQATGRKGQLEIY